MAIHKALQAVIALCISAFVIMVFIPFFFQDVKKPGPKAKLLEKIIDGVIGLNNGEINISTRNKMAVEYINLPRSNDLKGGAQFSYSFWMKRYGLTNAAANKILFMRGVKKLNRVVEVGESSNEGSVIMLDNVNYKVERDYSDVVVKCPLVKFGNSVDELVVQFNTAKSPMNEFRINADLLKILKNDAWYMITITFEDVIGLDGFENGVRYAVYINDSEIYNGTVRDDTLVLNNDNFIMFPRIDNSDHSSLRGNMADVTYYNYALTKDELTTLVAAGFNKYQYQTPGSRLKKSSKDLYYRLTLKNRNDQI